MSLLEFGAKEDTVAIEWRPLTLYRHGEIVKHEGIEYRVRCSEHGDECPGGGLRSGFLAPPMCIEDGHNVYEVVVRCKKCNEVVKRSDDHYVSSVGHLTDPDDAIQPYWRCEAA